MVINVCDGETVIVCDPPLDQDEVATEILRYNAGGFAKLKVRRESRVIEIDADRSGRIYCSVIDELTGACLRRCDSMFDAL